MVLYVMLCLVVFKVIVFVNFIMLCFVVMYVDLKGEVINLWVEVKLMICFYFCFFMGFIVFWIM